MSEKKPQLFFSEEIEPFAARCIGLWYKECEECSDSDLEYYCHRFWWGVQALNKLSIVTGTSRDRDGAVHFSIAISNEMRRVAEYIEERTGIDPFNDDMYKS